MLLLDCNPEVRLRTSSSVFSGCTSKGDGTDQAPNQTASEFGVCGGKSFKAEGSSSTGQRHPDLFLQVDALKNLLETGASVNAPPDPQGQSPVHLAAGGGLPYFLLWQLQAGADLSQQDVLGETALHKAAKVGSLECLSLLVASDAQIDLCNKNGQTAEDLAWSRGFPECAKFLVMVKCTQTTTSSARPDRDPRVPVFRQKRSFKSVENITVKRKC